VLPFEPVINSCLIVAVQNAVVRSVKNVLRPTVDFVFRISPAPEGLHHARIISLDGLVYPLTKCESQYERRNRNSRDFARWRASKKSTPPIPRLTRAAGSGGRRLEKELKDLANVFASASVSGAGWP
jgi:hypothetical protein